MKSILNLRQLLRTVPVLGILGVLILSTGACEQYEIVPPEVGYESFSTSIQPIFNSSCTGCHGGALDPNLTEGNSYVALSTGSYIDTNDPENSSLWQKLEGDHRSYTSAANRELILEWIKAGAPND